MAKAWTDSAPLPGGNLPNVNFAEFLNTVRARWPFLSEANAVRMARAYGTRIDRVLGDGAGFEDIGFGLSTREIDYLINEEWAQTSEDILWRRTKLGLRGGDTLKAIVDAYLTTDHELPFVQ